MSTLSNIIQTSNENRASDTNLSGKYNVRIEEDKFSMTQQEADDKLEEELLNENTDPDFVIEKNDSQIPKKKKFKIFNKIKFFKKKKPAIKEPANTENESENLEPTFDRIDENEAMNSNNHSQEQEPIPSHSPVQNPELIEEPKQLYFQVKIRNSGFWGKVAIRKGTWFVIIGLVLMSIGLTVVSVFWRWWYGPAVNIPCRTAGITLLSMGFFAFLFGLISNCMMVQDPFSKHFIGSPPRAASWILLASIFGLIIASDLMTIYYTYWHNRFVNNPMIAISIILFFFSPIAFVWSILRNFSEMKKIRIKLDPEYAEKVEAKSKKSNKNKKNEEKNELDVDNDLNETIDDVNYKEEDFQVHDESNNEKKGFRKKNLKLQPRTKNPIFHNQPQ